MNLYELVSEYGDSGEIESHELEGISEYVSGATVFLSDDLSSNVDVYLNVQESLAFHAELEEKIFNETRESLRDERMFERTGDGEHDWTLTDAAFQVIERVLSERYGAMYFDMAGDVISFDLHLRMGWTTKVEDVAGIFWENSQIVRFMNESDPGTYGTEYLFGSIMIDAMKESESA